MSPSQLAKLKLQTTIVANTVAGLLPLFTTKDPTLGLVLAKQIQAIPNERWAEVERDYNALKGNQVGATNDSLPEGVTLETLDKVLEWLSR